MRKIKCVYKPRNTTKVVNKQVLGYPITFIAGLWCSPLFTCGCGFKPHSLHMWPALLRCHLGNHRACKKLWATGRHKQTWQMAMLKGASDTRTIRSLISQLWCRVFLHSSGSKQQTCVCMLHHVATQTPWLTKFPRSDCKHVGNILLDLYMSFLCHGHMTKFVGQSLGEQPGYTA